MTETGENAELVLGELVGGHADPEPLECAIEGIEALQSRQKSGRIIVEKRLYKCANGLSLGCQRGGPLHLADKDSWEIFVLDERGIVHGGSSGWVSEEILRQAVTRLVAWKPLDEAEAAS